MLYEVITKKKKIPGNSIESMRHYLPGVQHQKGAEAGTQLFPPPLLTAEKPQAAGKTASAEIVADLPGLAHLNATVTRVDRVSYNFV